MNNPDSKTQEQLLKEIEQLKTRIRKFEKYESQRIALEDENIRTSETPGSEKYYEMLYENAPLPYQSLDKNANLIDVNQAWLKQMGYEREEVTGHFLGEFMATESAVLIKNRFKDFIKAGEIHDFQVEMQRKDGSLFWVSYEGKICYDETGDFKQTHCIFIDISERKKIEEKYRALFGSIRDAILIAGKDGKIIACNPAFTDMFGYTNNDIAGKEVLTVYADEEEFKAMGEAFTEHKNAKEPFLYTLQCKKKNGEVFPGETGAFYLRDEKGNISGYIGLIRDLTERMKAEDKIKASQLRLSENRALLHAILESPHGMIVFALDKEYRYTVFTSQHKEVMKKIWGVEIKIGMNMLDAILSPADRKKAKHNFDKALNGEYLMLIEEYGSEELQRSFWENRYAPIYNEQKEIIGLSVFVLDITERRQAEKKLQESEETYRNIFHNAQVGIFRTSIKNGQIIECNDQLAAMLGFNNRSEVIKSYITSENYVDAGVREKMIEIVSKNGKVENFEARLYRKDHSIIWVKYSARIFPEKGWIEGVAEDITRRKQTEIALVESENKFSSIVKSSPMGMHIYSLRPDGKLIFSGANPAADLLLGVDNSQFIGKTIEEAFPPLSETEIPERYREVAVSGNKWQTEQVTYNDGIISGAFEVHAFQTSPGQMVALFLEITERKKAEEEIRKYRDHLEELVKERTNELEEKNKELERLNSIFVGREFRIKELRDEVKELNERIKTITENSENG